MTLSKSYERCRALTKRHGTTYYWSTYLLPKHARPHVHALYAFCRAADDVVDEPGPATTEERRRALHDFADRFFADLAAGRSQHPILEAVVHTVQTHRLDPDCFRRFLHSMAMDLTVTEYETFDDLLLYMDGSAAVIGELMAPILGAPPEAVPHARDLGIAFQLTNFLRDVAEDRGRGRVYLPQEDLARFPAWPDQCRFQIERARRYYASADQGIAMLPPQSARCIAVARALYSRILDEIEAAGYDVFSTRATVPTWRKLGVVSTARLRRRSLIA